MALTCSLVVVFSGPSVGLGGVLMSWLKLWMAFVVTDDMSKPDACSTSAMCSCSSMLIVSDSVSVGLFVGNVCVIVVYVFTCNNYVGIRYEIES